MPYLHARSTYHCAQVIACLALACRDRPVWFGAAILEFRLLRAVGLARCACSMTSAHGSRHTLSMIMCHHAPGGTGHLADGNNCGMESMHSTLNPSDFPVQGRRDGSGTIGIGTGKCMHALWDMGHMKFMTTVGPLIVSRENNNLM